MGGAHLPSGGLQLAKQLVRRARVGTAQLERAGAPRRQREAHLAWGHRGGGEDGRGNV